MFHGRGYFDFTPQPELRYAIDYQSRRYFVDIDEYNSEFEILEYDSNAQVLIKNSESVIGNGDNIEVTLLKNMPEEDLELMLVVSQKFHILHSQAVTLNSDELSVTIDMSSINLVNGGVITISLYDARAIYIYDDEDVRPYYIDPVSQFPYQAVATRLAFILPSETLEISLQTDKDTYSPGQDVNYEITVVNKETGEPVEEDVFVSISVTDLTAFLQIDDKQQPPSLVSKVYLEKEVHLTAEYDFLNANEYLNYLYQIADNSEDDSEEANTKLELLLGTQKWRLFMFDPVFKQNFEYVLYSTSLKLSEALYGYMLKNLWVTDIQIYMEDDGDAVDFEDGIPVPEMDGGANEEAMEEGAEESGEETSEDDSDILPPEPELEAERVNFRETQLFTNFVHTENGVYSGSFTLSDLITKFQVTINAVSSAGVYGMQTSTFDSTKDFYIESQVPLFMTSGDELSVPIVLVNNRDSELTVSLSAETDLDFGELEHEILELSVTVAPESTQSVVMMLRANMQTREDFTIKLSADCGEDCSDSFTKQLRIIGRGFPVKISSSGFLGTSGEDFITEGSLDFSLASTYESGTLEAKAKVYTSQLDHIYEALSKLIRDPHGCFEQTSSTTYPLVMALMVMMNLPDRPPEVNDMILDGTQRLQTGYDRLLTFETSEGGYEWFGDAPGHIALTAYGLMQFHEMKEVLSDVDQTMIDRVTDWLLDKRNGNGGFEISSDGLDSFARPPPDLSDAYILWVLTSIGSADGLEDEINAVVAKAQASTDTYLNALVANILYNVGRIEEAREIARMLADHQDPETGEVRDSETSITRSSGLSLSIETTSLSTLAWLKEETGEFTANIELGVQFIVNSIIDGRYGSTQSTILALKVLVEYLKNSKLEGEGTFEISIDGTPIHSIDFDDETSASQIDFSEALDAYLRANQDLFESDSDNQLALTLKDFEGEQDQFRVSYAMQVDYKDLSPSSNEDSALDFTLEKSSQNEDSEIGDIMTYSVSVHNTDTEDGQGMILAIIRIPSCQEIDYNWLEDLQSSNAIAYFEVLNDNTDVVLYWKSMQPDETKQVEIQMTQAYDFDQCIHRPSKAYLYYNEDGSEVWSE